jgi:signal transduction histidine kinase/CheY-like chemotaxis protein
MPEGPGGSLATIYARRLRIVAIVVAALILGRQLVSPAAPYAGSLLVLRLVTSAIAIAIGMLSSPFQGVGRLRILGFVLGCDASASGLAAAVIAPMGLWEQSGIVVAVLLGGAVFMPWSWRWQASFAVVNLIATALVTLWLRDPTQTAEIPRVLVTVTLIGMASVAGTHLADGERQRLVALEAERREQEVRRGREQRLDSLTRLAGGFAHQFNNLLGGILTHASVLRDDATSDATRAELDQILAAARRGRDLTQELLRFGRNEPLATRPTHVADVVRSVTELARTILPDKAELDVRMPPDLPPVAADPDHLVQACVELVLNARDATRGQEGPRLTIAVAPETVSQGDAQWRDAAPGRYVRFSIGDTGLGMDKATLERVFEPFFSTKPMHQATGLGLAQVYQIVRDHRGTVRIESVPRRGTTVHLLIPVSDEQPAVAAASASPAPAPTPAAPPAAMAPGVASSGTILIVDDEEIVRSSLRRALTRFGYSVLEAQDGGTALVALQTANPPVDLVILDLVLPGGGAGIFEVLKAVRPDLKVLVSSGYSPDAENARALAGRADGFLPKPYEISELKRAVAQALGRAAA